MATKNNLPAYEYKVLSEHNSIRLLKLVPYYGLEDIACELTESTLLDTDEYEQGQRPEDYEAVSYCWGSQPKDRLLTIYEGARAYALYISAHLESAMRVLRSHKAARILWIDAICINQNDKTERSQQVSMMNQVYGQAQQVCIWLGDGDEASSRAMGFITGTLLDVLRFDRVLEDESKSAEVYATAQLMSRPWFSRRWVIQELALAERATIYCGWDHLMWRDFADSVSLFARSEYDSMRAPRYIASGITRLAEATENLFRISQTRKKNRRLRRLSLEHLVASYTVFEASDPRDTIYALLAIARDTTPQAINQYISDELGRLPETVQQQLGCWRRSLSTKSEAWVYNVDYSAPVHEVYRDFIAFSICHSDPTCALDVICRPWAPQILTYPKSAASSQDSGIPSWISVLENAAFLRLDSKRSSTRENADPLVGPPDSRIYRAAGTTPVSVHKLQWLSHGRCNSMFVEGFILDTVEELDAVAIMGILPQTWLKLGRWTNRAEYPPEELWRTLVGDRGPNGRNAEVYYARVCREALNMTDGVDEPGTLVTVSSLKSGRYSLVREFAQRVQAVIWNRRLVRTRHGHLGLVHRRAKHADFVCILYGCSVPVVMRRLAKSRNDLHNERIQAKQRQNKEYRKIMKKYLAASRQIARHVILICAVIAAFEYRLELTIGGAFYLNASGALLYLEYIRNHFGNRGWSKIEKWIEMVIIAALWLHNAFQFAGVLVIVSLPTAIALFLYLSIQKDYFLEWHWMQSPFTYCMRGLQRFWKPHPEAEAYYWEMIGECYVHGMMDGEAIAYQKENQATVKPQVFDLR